MKLICKNTDGVFPGIIEVGKQYEVSEPYKGCYTVGEYSVRLSNFESLAEMATRLALLPNKMIFSKPTTGLTVELLLTESYLICYSHTKGNHWNISGNHYKYYHDMVTGEFVSEYTAKKEPVLLKQRLLKADYLKIEAARRKQAITS